MKKIFSFVLSACVAMAASAQLVVSPTGMMDEIGMEAEEMAPQKNFVAGSNQLSQEPAIWKVSTQEVAIFSHEDTVWSEEPVYGTKMGWEYIYDYSVSFFEPVDSVYGEITDYDNIVRIDSIPYPDAFAGTFHAVNSNGWAVGEFGSGYGDKFAVKASFDSDEVIYLYTDRDVESGSGAYAISEDGNAIVGFYFDASWTTQACLWVNGGLTAADRIDLPAPTEDEFGCPIDYVAARWMSADASVILGYAQDYYKGSWVMVYWTREADGNYAVHAQHAHQYFTTYEWVDELDANGNPVVDEYGWANQVPQYINDNLYVGFEPNAISANGEWISLSLIPRYDPTDYNATEQLLAARLNIKTNVLELLPAYTDRSPIFFGIANDGTAAGASALAQVGPGPLSVQEESDARKGYVWPANSRDVFTLQQLFPNEEYFAYQDGMGEAAVCGISADGKSIVGYTNKTDGVTDWVVTSFIATLPATYPDAVENVESNVKAVKMIEDNQVVILRDGARYNVMGQKL